MIGFSSLGVAVVLHVSEKAKAGEYDISIDGLLSSLLAPRSIGGK